MASSYLDEQIPVTGLDYIRRFDERWIGLLGAEPQDNGWLDLLAERFDMESPLLRLPISAWNFRYVETRADNRDQDFGPVRFFDIRVKEFDGGVEQELMLLNQYASFRRMWDSAPERMKMEEREMEAETLSNLLETNPTPTSPESSVDGVALFHEAHPTETGATYSNLTPVGSSVLNLANLQAEAVSAGTILDSSGRKLRARFDTIMVPTALAIPLSNLLAQAFVPSTAVPGAGTTTVSNPYFNGMKVIENPYLTDVNNYYLIDSKLIARGFKPLINASFDPGPDLGLRRFDEDSDHFRSTGRVKISSHIYKGFSVAWPQAIKKVVVA